MPVLDLFKALADSSRLRLVAILLRGEFTVQELTRILLMGQSRISRHLKILAEAGVLTVKREGTWSYYRIGDGNSFFTSFLEALGRELESIPERAEDLVRTAAILDERRRRSQVFFNRHARQWDDLARTLLPVPRYLDRLLDLVPNGMATLEVGVGTGSLLPHLARLASRVIGVDHSPAMLEEARRRLAEEGTQGVELRLGEMTHLPIEDAGMGAAVVNMVLHHAAEPGGVLREVARTLAPGGTVVLADLARHEREWVRDQLADQWLGFQEEELLIWLRDSGFEDIQVERVEPSASEVAVLLVRGVKK